MRGIRPPSLSRAGRRTNAALLALLASAFVTGWLAFAAGTPRPAWLATVAHGLAGLGLLALVPWKRVVVERAGRRFLASWSLLAVMLVCLGAGVVEVFGGYGVHLGLSPIQVHVGSAFLLVLLLVIHLFRHRRSGFRRVDLSRRNLVRTGGFALAIGAGYAAVEGVGQLLGGPAARRIPTGSHGLAAAEIPATNWLLDPVPVLNPDQHRVVVAGRSISIAELVGLARPVTARLDCTSGWFADGVWRAVPLDVLLGPAVSVRMQSIEVVSVTGYSRRFPVDEAAVLWLAVAGPAGPLTPGTGAPVRLVAPHRRGFWWVKWVAAVRLSEQPAYAQLPFPPQ